MHARAASTVTRHPPYEDTKAKLSNNTNLKAETYESCMEQYHQIEIIAALAKLKLFKTGKQNGTKVRIDIRQR